MESETVRDLVKRLRDDYQKTPELCAEAADAIERLTRERDEAISALNKPSECGEEACVWHVTQHFKIKEVEAERDALRAERTRLATGLSERVQMAHNYMDRAEAAEAELATVREAIKAFVNQAGDIELDRQQYNAFNGLRAVLAAIPTQDIKP